MQEQTTFSNAWQLSTNVALRTNYGVNKRDQHTAVLALLVTVNGLTVDAAITHAWCMDTVAVTTLVVALPTWHVPCINHNWVSHSHHSFSKITIMLDNEVSPNELITSTVKLLTAVKQVWIVLAAMVIISNTHVLRINALATTTAKLITATHLGVPFTSHTHAQDNLRLIINRLNGPKTDSTVEYHSISASLQMLHILKAPKKYTAPILLLVLYQL